MLSRVAERMYWAGRYLERAENTARLVNTYSSLLLDLPEETGVNWALLLKILAVDTPFREHHRKLTEETVLRFLLADERNPVSIVSSLGAARENIRTSRDIVPTEGWECVNELYLMGQQQLSRAVARRRRFEVLSDCVTRTQQIAGLLSGTMSHGHGYRFLRVGNHLERADMTSRVVDVAATTLAYGDPAIAHYENTLWMTVLRSLSAYQMYRQHVRRRVATRDVIEFLLTDPQFPRSVMHALRAIEQYASSLSRNDAIVSVLARLQTGLHEEVEADGAIASHGEALHRYVDELQRGFAEVHQAIASTWFLLDTAVDADDDATVTPQ